MADKPGESSRTKPSDAADADDGDKPIATTTSGTPGTTSDDATKEPEPPAGGEKPAESTSGKAKRPDKGDKEGARKSRLATSGKKVKAGTDVLRNRIASIVWLLAVLAAVILAVGALFYALEANENNAIVKGVWDIAEKIDGPFWKIFEFYEDAPGAGNGAHDQTKEHLVNWGLAAVAYLVGGSLLARVIRP